MENNNKLNWITEDAVPNLVSVIIPTYNRESYLLQAIQSVIEQNYRPIECIIVDDGSIDNTKILVDKIADMVDPEFFIKYIYQPNSGSQVARNIGTKSSKGEFIQYLDSDDLLYSDKIRIQVDYLKKNNNCDAVFGDWHMGLPHNKELTQAWESKDMVNQLLTEKVIHTLAFLYKRTIVNKIGEWDVNIKRNQEMDFEVRGLLEGATYKYQSQICGLWRTHNEQRISNTTGCKEIAFFFEKWEKLLEKNNLLTENLKKNIANILFCAATTDIKKRIKYRNILLLIAIRLDRNLSFYNTKKMKYLQMVLGKKIAIDLWIKNARLHSN